jgi:AraC-like DNA-binding protein
MTGLSFPRELLEARQFHWDPQLHQVLRTQANQVLTQQTEQSIAARIHHLVAYADADVRPEMKDIARVLGMTERALRRRLAEEGSSFRELLDGALRERTLRLLRDPAIPYIEVAERGGFSELSAMHRAVRRWTDLTPQQVRQGIEKPTQ